MNPKTDAAPSDPLDIGNTALRLFLGALALMPIEQRQMTMEELGDRICLFCGAADPECPCWVEDVAEEVVS